LRRKLSREEERKYKGTNSLEWIGTKALVPKTNEGRKKARKE